MHNLTGLVDVVVGLKRRCGPPAAGLNLCCNTHIVAEVSFDAVLRSRCMACVAPEEATCCQGYGGGLLVVAQTSGVKEHAGGCAVTLLVPTGRLETMRAVFKTCLSKLNDTHDASGA
jgi:hypothetical protein